MKYNFAVVIPMANEQKDFELFTCALINILNRLECGTVYFIIDGISKDNTLDLSLELSKKMSQADPDEEVPEHYIENELKSFLNKNYDVNPPIPLKDI